MKFLPLIWAGIWRSPVRTSLTMLSVATAFLLIGVLSGLDGLLGAAQNRAAVDRLVVSGKSSIAQILPLSGLERIRAMAGVRSATVSTYFGGYYREPNDQVFSFVIKPKEYFAIYEEYLLDKESLQKFEASSSGAVIGAALAREKGWRVGDRITLESSIWSRKDGGHWDFDIVGIYDTAAHDDNSTLFLQQDYWEQGKAFGQGSVGSFLVRVMNPAEAGTVADKIDNAFANSPNETRTLPEKEYSAGFLRQLGDVGLVARLIVAVVAASMLLVVVSTMIQAVRERTPEFGVLRAIGYGPGLVATVILGETAMLCLLSAAAGFSSSIALFPHAVAAVSSTLFVSATRVPMETMFLVGAMAVALTLLSAVIPAYLVQRHRIVDSLTSEELRR